MIFPTIKDTCLICNNTLVKDYYIIGTQKQKCLNCKISYSHMSILIYLKEFTIGWHYCINHNGDVSNGFKKIFNIKTCKDLKEVINRIYKFETFK